MEKVYLVGNAHLDPVWLWRKTEGMSEVMSTFRSALERMEEFPDYVFTSACASYYQWVERVDPEMFAQIQRRVAEGRWAIAGGFWVQPDCNLPSGESFARHALYSQRYFKEKLGQVARVGYNVDSFGHNGMMPQLLVKSGMDSYVFTRPGEHENDSLPGDLFLWQSPDGSRVTAHRIRMHYCDIGVSPERAGKYAGLHPSAIKTLMLRDYAEQVGQPTMSFYGVGNHGGGPTVAGLQSLEPVVSEHPEVVFASAHQLFEDIKGTPAERSLAVVQGDLQHHASGCYAALSAVKAANRRAENELVAAETLNVLSHRLTGTALSTEALHAAWEGVMFNQFHDVLAGCSIREAYTDALSSFDAARDCAAEITRLAAQRISWRVGTTRVLNGEGEAAWKTSGEGAPVVVLNPHSFPVRAPVRINAAVLGVADSAGEPVPFQIIRAPHLTGGDPRNTLFLAEVPAMGYTTYYLYGSTLVSKPGALGTRTAHAGADVLENDFLRVQFDPDTGRIVSFYDRQYGREWAAGPMGGALVIDDEAADTWAHDIFTFDKEVGAFEDARVDPVENGPLRAAIRVRTRHGCSELTQIFSLQAGSRELQVECLLTLSEKHKIVKLAFPIKAGSPRAVYSMPFGFITKACDGREEPAQMWAGVFDEESGAGMALINDAKYSFCAKGGELRMIAGRAAIYADHGSPRGDWAEYQDQGEQRFSYALRPYSQSDPSDVARSAALMNQPVHVVLETHHDGPLDNRYAGIDISAGNVLCQTVKRAEDGGAYIARLYEVAGKSARARVHFAMLGATAELAFGPQEIKTLRIEPDGSWREVLMTEYELGE